MPLNDTLLNTGVTAMQSAATHLSLHSATPNASGSNEVGTRVAAGWPAAANGDFGTITNKNFTGLPASGPIAAVGFWSAASAGTYYGHQALTGDATANAAGEYTVVSLAVTGTAT